MKLAEAEKHIGCDPFSAVRNEGYSPSALGSLLRHEVCCCALLNAAISSTVRYWSSEHGSSGATSVHRDGMMTSFPNLGTRDLPGIRQRRQSLPPLQMRGSVYPAKKEPRSLLGGWRALCSSFCIVPFRPRKLSAFALIVAVVAAASSTLIVQAAQPDVCVMTPHDCADTAKVADCCCHADDGSHQGGPIESRTQLTVTLAHHPVELAAGAFADASVARPQIHTSPASIPLTDLATRFAPLLV